MTVRVPPPSEPGFGTQLRRRQRWKGLIEKHDTWSFRSTNLALDSKCFTGLTGLATALILALLAVMLGNILWHALPGLSWRFLSTGTSPDSDMFDVDQAGVLPMINRKNQAHPVRDRVGAAVADFHPQHRRDPGPGPDAPENALNALNY